MKKKYKILLTLTIVLAGLFTTGLYINNGLSNRYTDNDFDKTLTRSQQSAQFNNGVFENASQRQSKPNPLNIAKMMLFEKQQPAAPLKPISVSAMTRNQLIELQRDYKNQGLLFFRLGHSSLLILLDGEYWLTDPIFSQRASPFSFVGPERFHQPPLRLEDLPPIKGVIISHNHYDHLDRQTIESLADKTEHFYTPLGVGEEIVKWGIKREKVSQFDWWQSVKVGNTLLTATPAQHFSGRSASDGNQTLWSSWAVKGEQGSLFFSGDTGYSAHFKEIGEKLGPFNLSFMETGAYNKLWDDIHMFPEQAAQAHIDVKADYLIPIHNGTFDLSVHAWTDPFERIVKESDSLSLNLLTPTAGEMVRLKDLSPQTLPVNKWWQ